MLPLARLFTVEVEVSRGIADLDAGLGQCHCGQLIDVAPGIALERLGQVGVGVEYPGHHQALGKALVIDLVGQPAEAG